jgi:hypothetical protein
MQSESRTLLRLDCCAGPRGWWGRQRQPGRAAGRTCQSSATGWLGARCTRELGVGLPATPGPPRSGTHSCPLDLQLRHVEVDALGGRRGFLCLGLHASSSPGGQSALEPERWRSPSHVVGDATLAARAWSWDTDLPPAAGSARCWGLATAGVNAAERRQGASSCLHGRPRPTAAPRQGALRDADIARCLLPLLLLLLLLLAKGGGVGEGEGGRTPMRLFALLFLLLLRAVRERGRLPKLRAQRHCTTTAQLECPCVCIWKWRGPGSLASPIIVVPACTATRLAHTLSCRIT